MNAPNNPRLDPKPLPKSQGLGMASRRPADALEPDVPALPGGAGGSDRPDAAGAGQRPRLHLKNSLRFVLEDARRARATVERIVSIVDGIEKDVNTMLASMGEDPSTGPGPVVGIVGPAADFVCVSRDADDSVSVQIDDFAPVRFPGYLARFFELLLSRAGKDEDGLIPWKSREAIARSLAAKMHRPVREQYVNKLVNDLRSRMVKAGLDRRLIQTHDSKGVRFAQRSTGIIKSCPQANAQESAPPRLARLGLTECPDKSSIFVLSDWRERHVPAAAAGVGIVFLRRSTLNALIQKGPSAVRVYAGYPGCGAAPNWPGVCTYIAGHEIEGLADGRWTGLWAPGRETGS